MGLREQLREDLKAAMRAQDATRRGTIRMLEAAIKNAEIEKRGQALEDPDILAILQRQLKQRRDSIEQFERGSRKDLADIERAEIEVIQAYLPEQLSEDDIEAAAKRIIDLTGATGPGDRGKVMGPLMQELRGKADGSAVNSVVSRLLSP